MQASFGRLKQWLIAWEHRLDFRPAFKGTLATHEWAIWPFFLLLSSHFLLAAAPGLSLPIVGVVAIFRQATKSASCLRELNPATL